MDYCLAVKEGNTVLYAILAKMINNVPESTVNAALTFYSSDNAKKSLYEVMLDYPVPTIIAAVIAGVLIVLAIRGLKVQRKTPEG